MYRNTDTAHGNANELLYNFFNATFTYKVVIKQNLTMFISNFNHH